MFFYYQSQVPKNLLDLCLNLPDKQHIRIPFLMCIMMRLVWRFQPKSERDQIRKKLLLRAKEKN